MDNEMKLLDAIGLLRDEIVEEADVPSEGEGGQRRRRRRWLRTLAAGSAAAACLVIAVPVFAKENEGIYRIVDRFAPALADHIIPEHPVDEQEGIRMELEAVKVAGQQASLIVSFSDLSGSEHISGGVDLFDSYNLRSYGSELSVGGSWFLEYDAKEDKAYVGLDILGDGAFSRDKITLDVGKLLTDVRAEERELSLGNLQKRPQLKKVSVSGVGGKKDRDAFSALQDGEQALVLDRGNKPIDEKKLTVTGIAYRDGVLHIQSCRGDEREAQRNLQLIMTVNGREYKRSMGVCWSERIGGKEIMFDESWYDISPEKLKKCSLKAIYHTAEQPVHGGWEITTRIGETNEQY